MAHPLQAMRVAAWSGLLAATASVATVLAPPQPAAAAETAVVQEILDGNELFINQKQAKVKARASAPELVSTRNSRGQLAFGSGAAGRLNRFSMLKLGSSCFLLQQGQILVSGPQNGCTRSARLSVRGTNYLIAVQDDGSSEVTVLEGSVEVETLNNGEPSGEPSTTVEAGNTLRISPLGAIVSLLQLSAGDYSSILNGPLFSGFEAQLPGFGALESYVRSHLPDVPLPSMPGVPSIPVGPSLRGLPSFGLF